MKKIGRRISSSFKKYTAVLLAAVMVLSAGTCTALVFAEKGALGTKAQVLQAESTPRGETSGAGEAADAEPAFYESMTVDGVIVTVTAPEGVFPDGSALSVKSLGITSEENVAARYSFDINILDAEGKEIEPDTSYGEVSVSFRISDVPYYDDVNVYHGSEKMAVSVSEGFSDVTCEVETDSFSSYSVVFTYNELKYVLVGYDSVKLSAIQSALGLPGTVKSAVSSNPSLVSVTQSADGADWIVTSLQPFASEETLTLAIDGAEYIIDLTDPAGFTITGGTAGTDYTYDVTSDYIGTLTVLTDTALTITTGGVLTYHKIAISSGITANLTLHDANIEARQYYSKGSPIDVGTATLNLTVTGTNNLFISMNEYSAAALRVPPGGTLTITAASTGSLTADNLTGGWSSSFGAGIGGGTFFNTNGEGCGTVIINGGTITAKSYMGAGIGGGGHNYGQSGGTVKITGGTVNAESIYGAGIGGSRSAFSGGDGAEVTISGGTVSASSNYGAGIGGGYGGQVGGSGRTVIISGGTVSATSHDGAGIGGAHSWSGGGSGGTVAISGGTVNAASSGRGAGIGGGGGDPSNGLNVGGDGGQVTISGGTVTASGDSEGIGRGTGDSPHHNPSHGTVTITPSYPYIIVKAGADSSAPEIEGSPFHSWIDTVIDVSEQKYFHSREQTPIINVPSHESAPYTGAAQYPPAITVTEPEYAQIWYGTDGRNYVDSLPIFRDAGTHTIFYHIMAYSYATVTGSYLGAVIICEPLNG